jgi:hypothetical protein
VSVAAPARRRNRLKLDAFDLGVLAALAGLSFAVLSGLLLRTILQGGVISGADGYLVADPMQYLAWARQAGEHGLIANPYDLRDGPRAFLHPGLLISGGLYALGASPTLAYLAWKPVAVLVLFAGARGVVWRTLERRDDRRLALVLALFACSPVAAVVGWGRIGDNGVKLNFDFITGELWSGSYLWGYLFTAIAVGLLALGLLAYERARDGGSARRLALAAGLGLLVAWLQPWQGVTLFLLLAAAELICWRRTRAGGRRAVARLAVVGAGVALPLVYYLLLSRLDPSWELAGQVNELPRWPWWVLLLGPLPLALPAVLAYRLPARDFAGVAIRAWPLAALVVYFQPAGTFPFHAFQGLAIPLAVLGVGALRAYLGERPVPLRPVLVALVVLVGIGTAYRVAEMQDAVHYGRQPFFLEPGEHDALRHLDRTHEAGGVLAPVYMGILVPPYTGRETYIGAGSWVPDFDRRLTEMEDLFAGLMPSAQAAALVRRSGARFLLADCHGRADVARLERLFAGFTEPPRRFGCAAVWRVRA